MEQLSSPVSSIDPRTIEIPKKRDKGDFTHITNADFVTEIFGVVPKGSSVAICTKKGDPTDGGWFAQPADSCLQNLLSTTNNYVCCSSFTLSVDTTFSVRKSEFAACHFLMLDDLGTKATLERLKNFDLSYRIETSPGNHQGGIIFTEPITDGAVAENLLKALITAGLCDAGASGPLSRWARLPVAINGKTKHINEDGTPFKCRLVQWQPDKRYTPEEIISGLQLTLPEKKKEATQPIRHEAGHVLTPKAVENPVITAIKARNLYKSPLGSGKHDITCPWVHEHTDALDTGAAYFEPDEQYPYGGFCCQHSHRDRYHIKELIEHLGIQNVEARHKAVIRVVEGDLHLVVDAAERELANLGKHYQSGGLIVTVTTDQTTGDPSISPIGLSTLTRDLSAAATWEHSTQRQGWVRCDPPSRHVRILNESRRFKHLPPLEGLARQPYYRESDGELIMQSGYDKTSQRFGVFDPRKFALPELSEDTARTALALLEELLIEFKFALPIDKAAALSAIFTAVLRPSLPHAPAFHVRAPIAGSGKSYLCDLIGAFAGPGFNSKVSFPTTSEEATKVVMSLLLSNPAVVEFDDMATDWTPHGVINRMLTAEYITDRILGFSKTATVSTRTIFLGSGNNVGPVRDLLRRVLTIDIDPRCASPATKTYEKTPVMNVRQQRERYVTAVLTIIQAWKLAGSPRTQMGNIVTYDGAWSTYCRQPLMWLGYPDPATALIDQIKHDPDGDALSILMAEWYRAFGSTPTTVRKAVKTCDYDEELADALKEFPVMERGYINPSKLGWILKKNANRSINGYELKRAEADGRTAWTVVSLTPPAPPVVFTTL